MFSSVPTFLTGLFAFLDGGAFWGHIVLFLIDFTCTYSVPTFSLFVPGEIFVLFSATALAGTAIHHLPALFLLYLLFLVTDF